MLTECEQFARTVVLVRVVRNITISERSWRESKRAIDKRNNVVKFDSIWGMSNGLN